MKPQEVVEAIEQDPWRWDELHGHIADPHIDDSGHEVCGCPLCQAYCGICLADAIEEYERLNREMGDVR